MKKLAAALLCAAIVALSAFAITVYVEWGQVQETTPSAAPPIKDDGGQPVGNHNLFLQVSVGLVNARLARPVDRTAPVDEVILGTDLSGTSHTMGRATAQFAPDTHRAAIDIIFRATAESQTGG